MLSEPLPPLPLPTGNEELARGPVEGFLEPLPRTVTYLSGLSRS